MMKKNNTLLSLSFLIVLLFFISTCSRKLSKPIKVNRQTSVSYKWKKLETYKIRGRTDDLHFFDPMNGYVINSQGFLTLTKDGGLTWEVVHKNPGTFFRCLTFKNRKEGWLGNIGRDDVDLYSRDSIPLYETKDGGLTWKSVKFIGPQPKGLCGLQKVNDDVIVGCGRVRGPSYFIKTTDGGKTWYSYDLNHVAGSLIAPYFFDSMHGFLIGGTTNDKENCRSLVLETFDGGVTWDTTYISKQKGEYCWKFSFPTKEIGFISIQNNKDDGPGYYLYTKDGGQNWEEVIHTTDYYYAQGIGFIDSEVGWIGGTRNETYETLDGGKTWSSRADIGSGFNKFQFFGDSLVYGVGFGVFKGEKVEALLD